MQVMRSKYCRNNNFMEVDVKSGDSFIWRKKRGTRKSLQKELCFQVGNENNIKALKDPWVPEIQNFKQRTLSNLVIDYTSRYVI